MTRLEIWNQALAILGHDRQVASLEDTSTEALRCRAFYGASRDAVLARYPWSFLLKEIGVDAASPVSVPANFLRAIAQVDATSGKRVDGILTIENGKLVAKKKLIVFYISNDVEESLYPATIADAVVHELAYRLYSPIVGIPSTEDQCNAREWMMKIAQSKTADAITAAIASGDHVLPKSPNLKWESRPWVEDTQICNAALKMAGSERTIADIEYDTSAEADACRKLFPMAKNKVLSEHPWRVCLASFEMDSESIAPPDDFVRLVSAEKDSSPVNVTITTSSITAPLGTRITYVSSNIEFKGAVATKLKDAISYALASALIPSIAADEGASARAESIMKLYATEIDKAKIEELETTSYLSAPQSADEVAKLDIANRALSIVGSGKTIFSLTDDHSLEASRFKLLFPMAFRTVLAAHGWDFATRTISRRLAPDAHQTARFSMPADCVRILRVEVGSRPAQYHRDDKSLYIAMTSSDLVTVRYVSSDTPLSDASDTFLETLSYRLAANLAPSLGVKDSSGYEQLYTRKLSDASADEAEETAYGGVNENPFLSARR